MAALVQEKIYDEAGSHMLGVGHTHEDIGFLQPFSALLTFQLMLLNCSVRFFEFFRVFSKSWFGCKAFATETVYLGMYPTIYCLLVKSSKPFTIWKGWGWFKDTCFLFDLCDSCIQAATLWDYLKLELPQFFTTVVNFSMSSWWTGFLGFNMECDFLIWWLCLVTGCKSAEIRPWKELAPHITSLDNAYRPRKNEEDLIPHSFVFRRRESCWAFLLVVSLWIWDLDMRPYQT